MCRYDLVQYFRLFASRKADSTAAVGDVQFWLAVSALCAVSDVHTKANHERKINASRMCQNHDDGATEAAFSCSECELDLCTDCDRILHLSSRVSGHERQAINNVNGSVDIEVHGDSNRVKLPQLAAIGDRNLLKAVVEFKSITQGAVCRFCSEELGDAGQ